MRVDVARSVTILRDAISMLQRHRSKMLYTIVIGLVIGIVAKMLMPGRDPGGFIITTLLGIVGSVVAGYLGQALGLYAEGQPAGFLMSVAGAMLLLFIYRQFSAGRTA
jgi:uncharacterized membrane protein YeaQ/YmgE (transglycosylase-associated protein family)